VATVARILTTWSGGPSAPGLTVMNVRYTSGPLQSSVDAVRAFWSSLGGQIPSSYSLLVSPSADLFDSASGELTGALTAATPPTVVNPSGATAWAAGVGGRITWTTGAIAHGHRVKGRTFVVPLITSTYGTSGTVTSTYITTVGTAVGTLLSALNSAGTPLAVWTKKRAATDTLPALDGVLSDVTSGAMTTEVAVLAGRRKP
jgi:hypothetical protein